MAAPTIGIHDICFATTGYVLDLAELAGHRGVPVQKYQRGLGQDSMSVPAEDEDIVTLAAAAAAPILATHGHDEIRTVLVATETGVDQSKAAGLYLLSLLDLPSSIRVVELKQACYSGTAAIQFAAAMVAREPGSRVLVIATDIARYDLDTAAEATQGAAAVAMLISADPAMLQLSPISGVYARDISDFWRPNHRSTPVVAGKESIAAYHDAVAGAWRDFHARGGRKFGDFAAHCYHQPFTQMAVKAHRELTRLFAAGAESEAAVLAGTLYNRKIGNCYTASCYLGLVSLLDHSGDLSGCPVAVVSYGSGCVAEVLELYPVPGYRARLRTELHRRTMTERTTVSYAEYRHLWNIQPPTDGSDYLLPDQRSGPFRLAAISGNRRIYERRRNAGSTKKSA